jgi:hypothetical protein
MLSDNPNGSLLNGNMESRKVRKVRQVMKKGYE